MQVLLFHNPEQLLSFPKALTLDVAVGQLISLGQVAALHALYSVLPSDVRAGARRIALSAVSADKLKQELPFAGLVRPVEMDEAVHDSHEVFELVVSEYDAHDFAVLEVGGASVAQLQDGYDFPVELDGFGLGENKLRLERSQVACDFDYKAAGQLGLEGFEGGRLQQFHEDLLAFQVLEVQVGPQRIVQGSNGLKLALAQGESVRSSPEPPAQQLADQVVFGHHRFQEQRQILCGCETAAQHLPDHHVLRRQIFVLAQHLPVTCQLSFQHVFNYAPIAALPYPIKQKHEFALQLFVRALYPEGPNRLVEQQRVLDRGYPSEVGLVELGQLRGNFGEVDQHNFIAFLHLRHFLALLLGQFSSLVVEDARRQGLLQLAHLLVHEILVLFERPIVDRGGYGFVHLLYLGRNLLEEGVLFLAADKQVAWLAALEGISEKPPVADVGSFGPWNGSVLADCELSHGIPRDRYRRGADNVVFVDETFVDGLLIDDFAFIFELGLVFRGHSLRDLFEDVQQPVLLRCILDCDRLHLAVEEALQVLELPRGHFEVGAFQFEDEVVRVVYASGLVVVVVGHAHLQQHRVFLADVAPPKLDLEPQQSPLLLQTLQLPTKVCLAFAEPAESGLHDS